MTHFVSASCGGHVCQCGKPATHKLGEEIPDDEPCPACQETWRWQRFGVKPGWCTDYYHSLGPARHNLTAYVCCVCFTHVVGWASGCPLTDTEQRALASQKLEGGPVLCPRCLGDLKVTAINTGFMSADCLGCLSSFQIPF